MTQDERKIYNRERQRRWAAANPDKCAAKLKKYREANREKIRERERAARMANPERFREKAKRYRDKDKDAFRKRQREWRAANPVKAASYRATQKQRRPDAWREYLQRYKEAHPGKCSSASAAWTKRNRERVNSWTRKRFAGNPRLRAERALRSRLYATLKRQTAIRIASAPKLIGCDLEFFMRHIASLFSSAMTWQNYGCVWELDHILPCSSFDLTKEASQLECFHYTNLQPLPISENRRKHAKIITNITQLP